MGLKPYIESSHQFLGSFKVTGADAGYYLGYGKQSTTDRISN